MKIPNPLMRFGSDVLSRVSNLLKREKKAQEIIMDTITEIVENSALIASNTINTFMLRGLELSPLTVFPYGQKLGTSIITYNNKRIISLATLEGPVGSDSAVVDWFIQKRAKDLPILKMDFGTNIEISFIERDFVWTTSVPGGSVFSQGAALAGDIQIISWLNHLLSELLKGHVSRDGTINFGDATINPATCKAFMLAKAAIQTAIEELKDISGIIPKKLLLVGDLGMKLEPAILIGLGLVPSNLTIEKLENAILKALEELSHSIEEDLELLDRWIDKKVNYINFADKSLSDSRFNDKFLKNMNFHFYTV